MHNNILLGTATHFRSFWYGFQPVLLQFGPISQKKRFACLWAPRHGFVTAQVEARKGEGV